jgi:hypothetical protein
MHLGDWRSASITAVMVSMNAIPIGCGAARLRCTCASLACLRPLNDVSLELSAQIPMVKENNSTVVIWSGHIGSYEGHAPLLGKYLHKDLVNRGTLG